MQIRTKRARKIQKPHEFEILLLVVICFIALWIFADIQPGAFVGEAKQAIEKTFMQKEGFGPGEDLVEVTEKTGEHQRTKRSKVRE